MSAFERALRELESATAAIAAAPVEDFAESKAAMDRRQWAVTDLSELVSSFHSLSEVAREDGLRRLQNAADAGAKTMRRLTAIRSEASIEWNQCSRIYRALGATPPSKSAIDYRG